MKKFYIPLVDIPVKVFVGVDEFESYKKFVQSKAGYLLDYTVDDAEGLSNGTVLWIKDGTDMNTIFHEISHSVDSIMKVLNGGENEPEFRAYIQGYLGDRITEYCNKVAK